MGQWINRKLEATSIRSICVVCQKNPQKRSGHGYKSICSPCSKRLYEPTRNQRVDKQKRPYRSFVKDQCERCGFVPEHICQLDVDHKDGNHSNNEEANLQTLCANCHRLKTRLQG